MICITMKIAAALQTYSIQISHYNVLQSFYWTLIFCLLGWIPVYLFLMQSKAHICLIRQLRENMMSNALSMDMLGWFGVQHKFNRYLSCKMEILESIYGSYKKVCWNFIVSHQLIGKNLIIKKFCFEIQYFINLFEWKYVINCCVL